MVALSILNQLKAASGAAQHAAHDTVKLIGLETRLAALSLGMMIGLAVLAGGFVISAWLMLWGSILLTLVGIGLSWFWALLLSSLIQLAGAAVCGFFAYKLSRNLQFDVSRSLIQKGNSSNEV